MSPSILTTPRLFAKDNDLFLSLCLSLGLTRTLSLGPFSLPTWHRDTGRLPAIRFIAPLQSDRPRTACQSSHLLWPVSLPLGLISSQPALHMGLCSQHIWLEDPGYFLLSASCLTGTFQLPYPVLRPRNSLYYQGTLLQDPCSQTTKGTRLYLINRDLG